MFGEDAALVSLGLAQVGGVGFFEEQEEIKDMIFGKMQVDDPRSTAFSSAGKRHPGLSQSPTPDEKIAPVWILQQFVLKSPEILILHALGELTGKNGSFDESQRHRKGILCNPFKSTILLRSEPDFCLFTARPVARGFPRALPAGPGRHRSTGRPPAG